MSEQILPASDIEWTPRQRDVLNLLAKSRSNSEIAAELGISLDGAKWHVSEILAKLGADSRDDAADYWRVQNGLKPRLSRKLSGLTASSALRWVGATAVGTALVGGAVLLVVALSEDDNTPATDLKTPTAPAPSTATPTGTAAPPPTAPAGDVIQLQAAEPVGLENGWLIVYGIGCHECGGLGPILRAYQGPNGVVSEPIGQPLPGVYAYSGASDRSGSRLWAAVCLQGECGPLTEASPDARNAVYVSTDGGKTWVEEDSLEPNMMFGAAVGERVMTYTNPQSERVFRWWPDGEVIEPPLDFPTAFPVWVGPNEQVLWSAIDGFRYVHAWPDGTRVPIKVSEDVSLLDIFEWHADYFWASFYVDEGVGQVSRRIGTFGWSDAEQAFAMTRSWSWAGDVLWPVGVVSNNRIIARADFDEEPCLTWGCPVADPPRPFAIEVVVIDTNAGTVHPIVELDRDGTGNLLSGNTHAMVTSVVLGWKIARVATTEDCLPIRTEPNPGASATSCYVDGVLLWQAGETVEIAGTEWVPVDTIPPPEGINPGWAPASSLELQ